MRVRVGIIETGIIQLVCVCVCVCAVWPMEGDVGLSHLSVDTDDEGEDVMSPLLSTNPLLMRKWLGLVYTYT